MGLLDRSRDSRAIEESSITLSVWWKQVVVLLIAKVHKIWSAGTFERRTSTLEDPVALGRYCEMYLTGFFIISQSPVSLSYLQLQNASQLLLSMLGLSERK